MNRVLGFTDAIKEATFQAMQKHANAHMFGLGVTYPNGADGTTGGLLEKYPGRVHDIPCSENAITGMAVGMAASGLRPIVHHGRIEFAFYAVDPLLTQAANWNYMFGGDYPCPLTVRVALGRQWGNGPQHTRSARSFFAVPGLKVVVPSTPATAKGLLLSAVDDNNPVIFLEHRWLYKLKGAVPESPYTIPLDKARVMAEGDAVTVVAVGDMVVEALKAAALLRTCAGVSIEVIDLVSLYPMDMETILKSVAKTRNLIAIDASTPAFSVAHEVISNVMTSGSPITVPLRQQIRGLKAMTCPDVSCPTATSLTKGYYPTHVDLVREVSDMLGLGLQPMMDLSFAELNLAPSQNIDELLEQLVPQC